VISEINPGEYIELYNNTGSDITLSGSSYQFCSPFSYAGLGSPGVGAGIVVPARGYAMVGWPGFSDTDAGGEVMLYASAAFDSPGAIMDFVCWGVNPHGSRKLTAEAAGKWDDLAPCAPAITGGAIHRRVMTAGNNAASYDTASPPSPAMCTP
jgi:hypothetical protein